MYYNMPSRRNSQHLEPANTGTDHVGTDRSGDHPPLEYIHLSEVAAPAPIESPLEAPIQRHESLEDNIKAASSPRHPFRPPSHGHPPPHSTVVGRHGSGQSRPVYIDTGNQHLPIEQNRPVVTSDDGSSIPYQTPSEYANLTEVGGSWPVENPDEAYLYRHHSLEDRFDRRRRSSAARSVGGLDVVEAQYPQQPATDQTPPGGTKTRRQISKAMTELYTISYLVFFSLLGTLARIGLQSLTVFPGSPVVFGSLWANYAGSAVLGFLTELSGLQRRKSAGEEAVEDESPAVLDSVSPTDVGSGQNSGLEGEEEEDLPKPRRPAPLYVGLATGFCGSFTTFSGFMMDGFLALSDSPFTSADDAVALRRGVGRDILALLAVTFLTISACLSALKLGAHVAILLDRLGLRRPRIPLKYLDRAMVPLAWGSWVGAIFLALFPPDRPGGPVGVSSWDQEAWRPVLLSLVFAPLGCLLRFYASIKLNTVFPAFPLGTFTVNLVGTALFGMAWDLQHAAAAGIAGSLVTCQLLQGVMQGFCGCLTTVSTWATELSSLRRTHAYVYGSASVTFSLAALVVITGTMKWTVVWSNPVCTAT